MSHTLIIGLSGKAGAGKDTAADALVERMGFVRIAFADALRHEVAEAWCADGGWLTDRKFKERVMHSFCIGHCSNHCFTQWCHEEGFSPFVQRSPRWIMQMWGSWRRHQYNMNYWAGIVTAAIRQQIAEGHRHIVVTDCRYRNEADALRALGASIVRIHRPQSARLSADTAAHDSEHGHFDVDHHVHNDTTPAALADSVCDLALSLVLPRRREKLMEELNQ